MSVEREEGRKEGRKEVGRAEGSEAVKGLYELYEKKGEEVKKER